LAYVIQDKFEVTPGHHLIIPKRHFENYFELKSAELLAFNELLLKTKDKLRNDDASIEGFNIGINQGECAGQTIFHVHIHLIPRRRDDVEHPTGGVRNVFPGKGGY
jgi:diadenosine tetraphosphate (Ap4A) HIT family hydrolase